MKIYLICSVRHAGSEHKEIADDYVAELEEAGHTVHHPPRDVDQNSETGVEIVKAHMEAMRECDEVHVIWDVDSYGSHFDLGAAVAYGKKIVPVRAMQPDNEGKSYWKVMKLWEEDATDAIPDDELRSVIKQAVEDVENGYVHPGHPDCCSDATHMWVTRTDIPGIMNWCKTCEKPLRICDDGSHTWMRRKDVPDRSPGDAGLNWCPRCNCLTVEYKVPELPTESEDPK